MAGLVPKRQRMPRMDAADPFEDDRGQSKRKLRQRCRRVKRVLVTAGAGGEGPEVRELVSA